MEIMEGIEIEIVRSRRRTIALQLAGEHRLLVRAPHLCSERRIRAFVESQRAWIRRQAARLRAEREASPLDHVLTEAELSRMTKDLRKKLADRLPVFAERIGTTYGRVAVRRQKTRFGSCSSKGNLNFNCVLALMPDAILDYVIVHELCHRIEMNHSPAFWAQVASVLPDYRTRRKWLRDHGGSYIRALPESN